MTTTTILLLLLLLGISFIVPPSPHQLATAQLTSPPAQQILEDTWANCERIASGSERRACVSIAHDSPMTVVLGGDLLLSTTTPGVLNIDNFFIWQAVDGFKTLGYTIDSIELTGQGSEENPHNIMVVVSK